MSCRAAHHTDTDPCSGLALVTVVNRAHVGALGCELHAARLLAALGLRNAWCYPEPQAERGTSIRVTLAADAMQPPVWADDARKAFEAAARKAAR